MGCLHHWESTIDLWLTPARVDWKMSLMIERDDVCAMKVVYPLSDLSGPFAIPCLVTLGLIQILFSFRAIPAKCNFRSSLRSPEYWRNFVFVV